MALELMRGMLATANETSKPNGVDNADAALLTGEQAKTASLAATDGMDSDTAGSTVRNMKNGTPFGHGSRPFAALLPGMNMSMNMSAQPKGVKEIEDGEKDPASSSQAYRVDWVEFERLAGELCAR